MKYRSKINIRKFTYPQFSCACMKWWRGKEDTASDQTRFCILHASKAMPLEDLSIRGVTWKCRGIICPPPPVVVNLSKWGPLLRLRHPEDRFQYDGLWNCVNINLSSIDRLFWKVKLRIRLKWNKTIGCVKGCVCFYEWWHIKNKFALNHFGFKAKNFEKLRNRNISKHSDDSPVFLNLEC